MQPTRPAAPVEHRFDEWQLGRRRAADAEAVRAGKHQAGQSDGALGYQRKNDQTHQVFISV